MKASFLVYLLTSAVAVSAVPAFAQDSTRTSQGPASEAAEEDSALGDIVVTAQRRAESVQDVPIGISVVSSEQLDRQQVTQLTDLSRTSASLQFGSVGGSGGGGSGAFIRGIGTASLSRSAEGAVGIVVDGVVQGNTNINNLFDIARVEVLRGPQGTLFGQSVSAGVINISTRAPDPSAVSGKFAIDLSGDGFAGSEFGRQILRGSVNVPINAESAIRFSAYGGQTTGVLRNVFTGQNDKYEEAGFRARYLGRFGEGVTVNITGDYNYSLGQDGQFFTYIQALVPATATALTTCGVTARVGNFEHCSSPSETQRGRSYGVSGQVDVELGRLTLTSITGIRWNRLTVTGDIDRIADSINLGADIRSGVQTDYKQFTQELRLASDPNDPFSFTIGGFYYDADTKLKQNPSLGSTVTLPNGFITATVLNQVAESVNYSGFGEVRFRTEPFTFFAGARVTRSELSLAETRQGITVSGPIPAGAVLTTDYGFQDTDLSWRIGAQYEPTPDLMLYATVARGYKNGQLSPILVVNNVPILRRVIAPEQPTAFELGLKSTLFDGRLAFNLNGFYQKIKNLQGQTFVTLSDSPVPALLPTNISEVVSKGFEVDAFGRIGSNLTVNFSAVYNVARYPSDYTDQANVSLKGQQIAFAPRFSATFSSEYTVPLSGQAEAFISFDARYRSKTRLTDVRLSEAISVDQSRWVFGGRIGARVEDRWSVAVFANNIGASRVPSVFNLLLGNKAAFYSTQSARQIGLQAQFEF